MTGMSAVVWHSDGDWEAVYVLHPGCTIEPVDNMLSTHNGLAGPRQPNRHTHLVRQQPLLLPLPVKSLAPSQPGSLLTEEENDYNVTLLTLKEAEKEV